MKPASFLPAAEEDLLDAVAFLEGRRVGLGARLLEAVETAIGRIESLPASGTRLTPRIRRALVNGFPYSILYHEATTTILVVAVAHQKRRPDFWRGRVHRSRRA